MAKAPANLLDEYEYMDENSIDAELKCALCMSPFQSPSSGTCGHTFCQACIHPWINRQSTCPTCRTRASTEDFKSISARIIMNQLDRLLIRCKRCDQANMPRGDVHEHEKRCPNQTVSCPAFDIKCMWKGTRSALEAHKKECNLERIRPAIDGLYEHMKDIYEPLVDELNSVRQHLETQLARVNGQNRFLLAVFNKGRPMTDRCSNQGQRCHLKNSVGLYHRNQRVAQDQGPSTQMRDTPIFGNQQRMNNPFKFMALPDNHTSDESETESLPASFSKMHLLPKCRSSNQCIPSSL